MNGRADIADDGLPLTDRQRLAWLRLIRSDNVGPITFRHLINHFGSAETAIELLPELSQRGGATRRIKVATSSDAERELETARHFKARFIGLGEPGYPSALRMIDGAPPILSVKGDLAISALPAVGLVGARNASLAGCKFAATLARGLGAAGYATISGLARGIDAAAHTASIDTGTIAAMAGGLDKPYPPENRTLYERITQGEGLAISEMPFGWEPRARDFPRRNRLIAGTSLGLIVVEAARRSGSLITARLAGEFGRLVFAVPGSPLDPRAAGTNGLLKDGAEITTSVDDVLEALAPVRGVERDNPTPLKEPSGEADAIQTPPDETDRMRVIDALGPTPNAFDDLVAHTGLRPAAVHLILLELELAGRLQRHPGGFVSMILPDGQ